MIEAATAMQLVREPAAARPHVARAVDPGLRRQGQIGILVHPLRIVGREHVRLDPERGQVRRELERPLHSTAARGREVHRHEEDLHAARS